MDDGSNDETEEIARSRGTEVIQETGKKVLKSCDRIVLETHQYQGRITTSEVEKVLKREGFKTRVDSEFIYGWKNFLPL